MSEWWTYSLADFLMFSPGTYWRLFELYNHDIWPAQLPALAAGVALPLLAGRQDDAAARCLALLLALGWAWTGWGFLFARYDTINWAGRYLALGFAVEALLIAGLGIAGRLRIGPLQDPARRVGLALFLVALLLHPLLAGLSGRAWAGAEIFGLAPDPTAIGTLGLLLTARRQPAWLPLSVIPLLWCIVSGATLWTMGSWQAALPIGAVLLGVGLGAFGRRDENSITM